MYKIWKTLCLKSPCVYKIKRLLAEEKRWKTFCRWPDSQVKPIHIIDIFFQSNL